MNFLSFSPARESSSPAPPFNRLILLLTFSCFFAPLSFPQARIHFGGTVTDFSHNPISGVSIDAQNEQTGETFSAVSAADGSYTLDLPPGVYSFRFTAKGHSPGDFHHVPVPHPEGAVPLEVQLPPPKVAARPPSPAGSLPQAHADGNSFPPAGEAHHDISGRAFLVGNEDEEDGFGLYSYLLIPAAPLNDEDKKRYLAVIESFLSGLSGVAELEAGGALKSDLNVTYLLLTSPNANAPKADWILEHYDFARAKNLLRLFSRAGHDVVSGPYVVSSLIPLIHSQNLPEHYLWQDMSHVPASLAASWEKEFERRASKKEFWSAEKRNQIVLEFRDFIATAAVGLPVVSAAADEFKKMLASCISWK